MTDRFSICLPFTLAQECPYPDDWSRITGPGLHGTGNYSDDAGDKGGPTMCGITHIEYNLWRKGHGLLTQDVRKMPQEEGYAIYRVSYWEPHCSNLAPGVDLFFFDTSVNMGSNRAVKLLQASLGVTPDGDWGPKTSAAMLLVKSWPAIIKDEQGLRAKTYESFGAFRLFGQDWLRRDQEIGAEALKMAA
jgi:lysozyme family protein